MGWQEIKIDKYVSEVKKSIDKLELVKDEFESEKKEKS